MSNHRTSFFLMAAFFCSPSLSEAQENLSDYLPLSWRSGAEGLIVNPSDDQIQYMKELEAETEQSGYAMAIDDSGTVSGTEALSVLQGESSQAVARYSIQFQPGISRDEMRDALIRNELLVTETAPNDLVNSIAKVISPLDLYENSEEYEEAFRDTLELLESDPSFLSVTPDISSQFDGMQAQHMELSLGPMPFGEEGVSSIKYISLDSEDPDWGFSIDGEDHDWGLKSIRAPDIWDDPRAQQGKSVGVLDVGFAMHDDLPFWDMSTNLPIADHGNHVAGILCAKHDGKGVSGVLPTCLIVPRAPKASTQPDIFGIKPDSIAAVLNSFREIVVERPDIKVINVSLGYNWRKRFNITNLDNEKKQEVANIASQLVGIYQLAQERDIFIVTAAGNDSWEINPKLNSAWASPMNFASIAFCQAQGLCNGVVIEAHDKEDLHADFSNIGGSLSCPGVNIISASAYDEENTPSLSGYAEMSGTSMASPYCAGGLVLLSMVRPKYSAPAIIECARQSGRSTGAFSAPALDLVSALEHCPPM